MAGPPTKFDGWLATLGAAIVSAWAIVRPGLWRGLLLLRLVIVRSLEVLLAVALLFEEWGWRPLAALLAQLRRIRLWAQFEDWVQTLPPYPSLAVFALPSVLILPLKLAALWLIAHGHVFGAGILFVGAKIVGTAIVARLFVLLQPKLMQIGWFARAYNWLMPWKEALFARIRASWAWRVGRIAKARIKKIAGAAWRRLRPAMAEWWAGNRPRIVAAIEEISRRIALMFRRSS